MSYKDLSTRKNSQQHSIKNGNSRETRSAYQRSVSESEADDSHSLMYKSRTDSDRSMTLSYSSSYYGDGRNLHSSGLQEQPKFGPKLPVTLCILFTELCERLVYYGVAGNLLVFLTNRLSVDSALASSIVLIFTGVSFIVPIFGGWVADSIAGKYNTLYGSILIYLVGTFLLPAVAYDYQNHLGDKYVLNKTARWVFFAMALLFISIGTGGIKANVSPFGAEQVQSLGPKAITIFFNWFYWFINVGSFVAYTAIVYIQTNYSFFWGYLILTIAILIATILLTSGRNKYLCKPPNGSIITDICKIMHKALKRKWMLRRLEGQQKVTGMAWLDYARVRYGGPYLDGQVDTVLALFRILPIFILMILYWTIYFQMQTSFLLQGLGMNLNITDNFTIPPASLSLFDVIIILVLIPFMDRVIYRLFAKFKIRMSSLRRMGIGMIFAIASVIVAARIEVYRRDNLATGRVVTISGKQYKQSNITVFYQVPQFVLIGISEVFTSISGLEFAYSQSPKVLQGVVMGLFLMTSGLGSFLGSALVQIVNAASYKAEKIKWYDGKDINDGKLDYFFYLLALLLGVNFLVFCAISVRYTFVNDSELRKSENDWSMRNGEQSSPHSPAFDDDPSNDYTDR